MYEKYKGNADLVPFSEFVFCNCKTKGVIPLWLKSLDKDPDAYSSFGEEVIAFQFYEKDKRFVRVLVMGIPFIARTSDILLTEEIAETLLALTELDAKYTFFFIKFQVSLYAYLLNE